MVARQNFGHATFKPWSELSFASFVRPELECDFVMTDRVGANYRAPLLSILLLVACLHVER